MNGFNFKRPDYTPVIIERMRRLEWVRADAQSRVPALKLHYKHNPWDFIDDWGWTFDPRNADTEDIPAYVPFVLMPKQREWLRFAHERWKNRKPALTEKTRDCGVSWLAVSFGCAACLFNEGVVVGYGSRKEIYVDQIDGPKSLFFKAREFMSRLPSEFNGGWDAKRDAPHMRLNFRETKSVMNGEAGDGIGRGDRASLYFVDEEAFLERPELVERSLSATTRCRHSISTPNGPGNPFAIKRHAGRIEVFTFSWRDDLRKDEAWYAAMVEELDAVTVAQEIDINYNASVEGAVIPSLWINAAVDAHKKLGLSVSGVRMGALDVADEGFDKNAYAGRYGFLLEHVSEWSGKGGDIFFSLERAFNLADDLDHREFLYDADGIGAGARGDARIINGRRDRERQIAVNPFWGSGAVINPEREEYYKRKNVDFFQNFKAQAWWSLRQRFLKTYRWVAEQKPCAVEDIVSIDSGLVGLASLISELSQPTYSTNNAGKIVIDKAPDGARSPNKADAVNMVFSGARRAPMRVSVATLAKAARR